MSRPLVILDLNGTLLQRLTCDAALKLLQKQNPDIRSIGKIHGRPIISRPGATKFLGELMELADVAVWTSAQTKNAVPMVMLAFSGILQREMYETVWKADKTEHLDELKQCCMNFKDRKDFPQCFGEQKLAFLWTQTQCEVAGYKAGDRGKGDRRPEFTKSLNKVWKLFEPYNSRNTIIIDDSHQKIPKTQQGNLIAIPEFSPEGGDAKMCLADDTLERLSEYLRALVSTAPADVRQFMASNPFS